MTTLRTAAQQALEAMEREAEYYLQEHSEYNEILLTAITALKAALAEPVQEPVQEPVAWYHVPYPNNGISPMVSLSQQHEPSLYGAAVPLYLAPPIMEPKIKTPKEEPVAWMVYTEGGTSAYVTDNPNDLVGAYRALALYTSPPQRKPLDDLAIADIYTKWDATPGTSMADFARAIEKAHGIGVEE